MYYCLISNAGEPVKCLKLASVCGGTNKNCGFPTFKLSLRKVIMKIQGVPLDLCAHEIRKWEAAGCIHKN